jgi:Mor family transcriptional regulator
VSNELLDLIPFNFLEVVDITDEDTAMQLVNHFGGRRVYIPKYPREGKGIAQAIGLKAASKLAARYGGDYLHIPFCQALKQEMRDRQILSARQQGAKTAELAKQFNLSQRRVQEIIADQKLQKRVAS